MIEIITISLNFMWLMYGPRGGIRTQKPTYRLENGYSIQLSYTRVIWRKISDSNGWTAINRRRFSRPVHYDHSANLPEVLVRGIGFEPMTKELCLPL